MIKPSERLRVASHGMVIDGVLDPLKLTSSAHGEWVLLESADIITRLGERSMLLLDMALKIEARDNRVVVSLLQEEGKALLKHVTRALLDHVVSDDGQRVTFAFSPLHTMCDLDEKMAARSSLDVLRAIMASVMLPSVPEAEAFMSAGIFAYDFLDHFEALPHAKRDVLNLPDFLFFVPLTTVIIDHKEKKTKVFCFYLNDDGDGKKNARARLSGLAPHLEAQIGAHAPMSHVAPVGKVSYSVDMADGDFYRLVEDCLEYIKAGDVYQIVPSRTFIKEIKDPFKCYRSLRELNPSPYMFLVKTSDFVLFGASPETFIKVVEEGRKVSVRPIAGTRRRGFDASGLIDNELDSREQASLVLDEKELAEHMMLVDLARNDVASVCKPTSRRVARLLGVDKFSHVMHLVSEVEGTLTDGFDALSAYQASMNMGTLMGAPKVRAAQILRQVEHSKRGFYGGAIGYLNALGNMDTAIIIRSALVKGETAYIRAGCGVVYDSKAAFEVQETKNKAEAVLRAIESEVQS